MADKATSTTKLLDTLNDLNLPPKLWNEINIELAAPESIDGEAPQKTRLLVKSVPGRGYYNDVSITYNRIDITSILDAATVASIETFTVDSIITLINNAFGLFLTADDLVPFTPPVLGDGESQQLTIAAAADSRGFVGSVQITLTHARTPLETIIAIKLLPVRNHPVDVTLNQQSARMLTWGRDFTSLRDAIAVKSPGNAYTDWDSLQAGCQYMGIPSWVQGQIRDVPTSSVPDSNPAFARVVIQDNVTSQYMKGSVYMHYNILEGA